MNLNKERNRFQTSNDKKSGGHSNSVESKKWMKSTEHMGMHAIRETDETNENEKSQEKGEKLGMYETERTDKENKLNNLTRLRRLRNRRKLSNYKM